MSFFFRIIKGNTRPTAALLLKRIDGERLLIILGWKKYFGVAAGVAAVPKPRNFEELEGLFHPHAPGTYMALENHRVRVDLEPQTHHPGIKCYMVDIAVKAIYQARNQTHMNPSRPQSQCNEGRPDENKFNDGGSNEGHSGGSWSDQSWSDAESYHGSPRRKGSSL